MMRRVSHTRVGLASSLLILVGVMLLAGVGAIYLAEPAAATGGGCSGFCDCTPDQPITLGDTSAQNVDGVTFSLSWNQPASDYLGFTWTDPDPVGGEVRFAVQRHMPLRGWPWNLYWTDYVGATYDGGTYTVPSGWHIEWVKACGQFPKGKITIEKATTTAGGAAVSFPFSGGLGSFSLKGGDDKSFSNLSAATYTISEGALPGTWYFGSAACTLKGGEGPLSYSTGDGSVTVDLAAGQRVECTFTNHLRLLPNVTVVKKIDLDGDGIFESSALAGEFGFSLDGDAPVATDGSGQVLFSGVAGGDHGITESQLGFSRGTFAFKSGSGTNCTFNGDVATASVVAGKAGSDGGWCPFFCPPKPPTYPVDATCTFENGPEPGDLTIVKVATPEDDTPFQFSGTYAGGGVIATRAAYTFSFPLKDPSDNSELLKGSGDYTVTEGALPAGWRLDDITCEGTEAWSRDGSTLTVTVGDGDAVTCYFHNSGHGRIVVRKAVVTPGAPAASFGFNSSFAGGFSLADGGATAAIEVPAGVYSAAEVLTAGQVADGWSLASAYCNDGSGVNAIGVSPGETVTCTFENTYQAAPGYLKVVKVVEGGPAACADFSFHLDGNPAAAWDASCASTFELPAGSHHSVVETAAADYTVGYDNCSNVEIVAGETAVCTVTNTHEEPGPGTSLTIAKVERVGVGSEVAGASFDFTGDLGAFSLVSGASQPFDVAPGTYAVTEVLVDPWALELAPNGIVCTGAADGAVLYDQDTATVTVTLAEGDNAICTFHNYDSATLGPELPYTGSQPFTMPLLIAGLWAVLMGLGLGVWGLMRQTDKN